MFQRLQLSVVELAVRCKRSENWSHLIPSIGLGRHTTTTTTIIDGETFGCVKILCYLGDTLGGADLATTA